jgi:hypothetical protein
MTKNHKDYVIGIVDIMAMELRDIKTKMENTYHFYQSSVETDRVWEHLLKEMYVSSQTMVTEFVKNRGVIRKQRVSKDKNDKNDDDDQDEDKDEKNTASFSIYCKKFRKNVRESNPGYNAAQITKCLGEMWKKIPQPEREQFK